MKRFAFRLQRLLEVRRTEEKEAEGRVARAAREVRVREERLRGLEEMRSIELAAVVGSSRDGRETDLRTRLAVLAGLDRAIAAGQQRLGESRAELASRIEAWRRIRSQVGALESLRERERARHRRASIRGEEKTMDERHLWPMVRRQKRV